MARMRNVILHLSDMVEDGSHVRVDWRRREGQVIVELMTTDTSRAYATDAITADEMVVLLDALEPWLIRHWHRMAEAS
jgi:hypothetical protein